jgi:iron complex transport system substrate-binding protein
MTAGRRVTRAAARVARTAAFVAIAAALLTACRGDARRDDARHTTPPAAAPLTITDDAGGAIHLAHPARRIISLVPSATETLIAVGAGPDIVGRTRYDVAPAIAAVPSVGGGIDPSVEAIVALHPDLVVAWDDDQRADMRAQLASLGIPVFALRTEDTSDVFRGIANLGRLTAHDSAARAVVAAIHAQLDSVRQSVVGRPTPSALFVVYTNPPMTAGPMTFIGQLIGLAGGRSIFADATALWPTVAMEQIVRRQPDVIIMPTGEFSQNAVDALRARAGWRDLRAVRDGRVVTVSADLVNRPGPNIAVAARALRDALHPELAGRGAPRR